MDVNSLVELKANPRIPAFRVGDTVRVHAKVVEGDRERIQAFEGVVIRIRRGGINSNFTVRRISHGVGVERVFPYYSPLVDKVDVMRVGRVRRAKLYYLRERVGKAARLKAGSRERFEALAAGRLVPVEEDEEAEEMEPAEEPAEAEETLTEAEAEAPEGAQVEAADDQVVEAEAEAEAAAETEEEPAEGKPEEPEEEEARA